VTIEDDSNLPENKKYTDVLKKYFGYNTFRKPQLSIIKKTIEEKRDQLVVMATGRGKSLCYQFPALFAKSGITVVISPLISLMEDQVMSLRLLNVEACLLGSAQSSNSQTEEDILDGKYKVLYITPEYIGSVPEFLVRVNGQVKINLLAIDECHCVSQWGNDFRPAYRNIGKLRRQLMSTPVIALTATATPDVRKDILASLNLINPIVTVTSFDRPNLFLSVSQKSGNIIKDLKQFMQEDSNGKQKFNGSTIVYCNTKKATDEIINALKTIGIECGQYHAGLSLEKRKTTHFNFINDKLEVIAATVAFGMGIDKPDIRNIIHYGSPKEMESYYQEIGRAGRDGDPSKCHIFYESKDFNTIKFFFNQIKNETYREHQFTMLERMRKFLTTNSCRRVLLLSHFEVANKTDSPTTAKTPLAPNCCDNCSKRLNNSDSKSSQSDQEKDYTEEAIKLLSCIRLLKDQLLTTLILFLHGSKSTRLTAKISESYFSNKFFGSGKAKSENWWKAFAQQLTNEDFLGNRMVPGKFSSFSLCTMTQKGKDLLDSKIKVVKIEESSEMKKANTSVTVTISSGTSSALNSFILPSVPVNQIICSSKMGNATNKAASSKDINLETELYKHLITVRSKMVEEFGLSAHKICTNKALSSLAYTRPSKVGNLARVEDFPLSSQKIGTKFIEAIVEFCNKFKLDMDAFSELNQMISCNTTSSVSINDPKILDLLESLSDTKQLSYKAFEIENKSIETISMERSVGASSVIAHLEDAILMGLPLNFTRLGVTTEKIIQIERALRAPPINSNVSKLSIIKEQVPSISWDDLKICLALIKRKYGVGVIYHNASMASTQPTLSLVNTNEKPASISAVGNQSPKPKNVPDWMVKDGNKRSSDDSNSSKNADVNKKKPKLNL